jgi:hypothetical protein
LGHIELNNLPGYRLLNNFKRRKRVEKLNVERLKNSLDYLQSKQRELKRQNEEDTRTLESLIKYLKKDMIDQYKLTKYDLYIKQDVKDTETFINSVQKIIEDNQ